MPLGVEDGRVPDPLMRASSSQSYYCRPFNARLNRRRYGRQGGAWCVKRRDRRQWLQIDFGALTRVTRVATQGRQNSAQWVTSYYISYSRNGYKFIPYREGRRTKVKILLLCFVLALQILSFLVYSQLSPCGRLVMDTPIVRTATKSSAKINYRRLTEINSRYYGLSLLRTLINSRSRGCP